MVVLRRFGLVILLSFACSVRGQAPSLKASGVFNAASFARHDPASVVISSGLETGEIVVTAGAQTLRPGQKVRLLGAVS